MYEPLRPLARSLVAAALALLLAGCGTLGAEAPASTDVAVLAGVEKTRPGTARVRAALLASSRGLLYPSETDAPWTWTDLGPASALPDAAAVAARLGFTGPGVEAHALDADAWFARLVRNADPADPASVRVARRHEQLRRTFRRWYTDVRVYRVRDALASPAEWHVVVLGVNEAGVTGLRTLAVET
ncbi:nuclease A inhibitor family protein [Deinococcus pimensis]|uniref:nuclease A inhibitor family protein n=1 Tax=Deinococcus pimensis TaxID=309888 RepID=UPI00048618CD|nr:nuclease A inhibitor family protein [Deinococcus pimensis]